MGKTTVCHLILKLFDPNSGRINLDGIDLRELDIAWFRKHIALVSQNTFLSHTSIMENICFSDPEEDHHKFDEKQSCPGCQPSRLSHSRCGSDHIHGTWQLERRTLKARTK
jgi:ABC-type iron transport system FetAB ATPase subunit